jgi:hypothetical protein
MLTEDEVVSLVREYLEGQFPKQCTCCGRVFPSLKAYLLEVTHIGDPVCWALDNEMSPEPDALPAVDAMAFSNCPCGTTLTVGSDNMSWWNQWKLLVWGGLTRIRRGVTTGQLMAEVRERIDAQVLGADRTA